MKITNLNFLKNESYRYKVDFPKIAECHRKIFLRAYYLFGVF